MRRVYKCTSFLGDIPIKSCLCQRATATAELKSVKMPDAVTSAKLKRVLLSSLPPSERMRRGRWQKDCQEGRKGGRADERATCCLLSPSLTHSLTLSAHSSSDVHWANGRSRLCVVNVIIQSDKFCCAIEPKERTGWTGAEA